MNASLEEPSEASRRPGTHGSLTVTLRGSALYVVLFVVSLPCLGWLHGRAGFAVDDGFIVLRYVEHLLAGEGLVYNVGERVEGFSSPLWTFLVAALEGVGRFLAPGVEARPELVQRGLGVASGAAAVVAVTYFARERLGCSWGGALGAALGLLVSWPFVFWSGAGLEAPLFGLLLVGLAIRLTAENAFAEGSAWGTAAGLLAVAVCRPEGPWFAAWGVLAALWTTSREARRRVLSTCSLVAAGYGALLLVRVGYYGEPLPNTFYAKVGGGPFTLLRGGAYLADYLVRGGGLPMTLLVLASGVRSAGAGNGGRGPSLLPAFALLGAGIVFTVLVGGDGLYCFRFVAHLLPPAWPFAARGAERIGSFAVLRMSSFLRRRGEARLLALLERIDARGKGRWLSFALLGVALFAVSQPLRTDERLLPGVNNHRVRESELAWLELGRALARVFPSDALLATNIAGKVPYGSKLPTVDILGLTDRAIARTPMPSMGKGYAGHEKANVAYVLERRPTVLFVSVFERLPDDMLRSPTALEAVLAQSALYGYAPLFADAAFLEDYRPAVLSRPPFAPAPLFVRRDRAPSAPALVLGEWTGATSAEP